MKCFEIFPFPIFCIILLLLTVNMKCFEIKKEAEFEKERFLLTVNMKCFEIFKALEADTWEKINRKHEMF